MINIAKLLKDAPKGMKLYSPLFGEVEFMQLGKNDQIWIKVDNSEPFDKYGRYFGSRFADGECLLFPSKDCRTWEGWKVPVEPKFKVGDKVIYNGKERTITFMDNKFYDFDGGCAGCRIEKQDELLSAAPKKHYDIANLKPFDKVLVRCSNDEEWMIEFYCKYDTLVHTSPHRDYPFMGIGDSYSQCIPFEGNEHLLGTTDMCDEQYINW